jgi:hypothetical protein
VKVQICTSNEVTNIAIILFLIYLYLEVWRMREVVANKYKELEMRMNTSKQ